MKKILILTLCLVFAGGVTAQHVPQKSSSIITIAGEQFFVHTVAPGDAFYSLSKLYGCEEETIRQNNPHAANGLQAGQVLKIPAKTSSAPKMSERKKNRLFDTHVVNQGETAYSISKRYGVALAVLMEDNPGFDPAHLSIGQQVNIRIESQGKTDSQELEKEIVSYRDALNSVSDQFEHHVVTKGETMYSLSKLWNVPIEMIVKYNPTETKDGLKVGAILRIPSTRKPQTPTDKQPEATPGVPADVSSPASGGVSSGVTVAVAGAVESPRQVLTEEAVQEVRNVKNIDVTAPIKVAVLLPLKVGAVSGRQYLEFYQGMLIAFEELKKTGISVEVDLFNTARSPGEVRSILKEQSLGGADLIVGPVYDECFSVVADFAAQHGIPAVSPLAAVESADNSLLFQVSPAPGTKYDKLKADLSDTKNVIVISSSSNDAEFTKEIEGFLPGSARRINYTKGMPAAEIENHLSKDKENVLVVLSGNENTTDDILARISSIQNNLTARSIMSPAIKVIGNSRWARFQNIDKNLFFKLNLRYVTSYHADRGSERVAGFDRRYVAAFSSLPTLYSYRGYDVAKLFVGSMKLHGHEFVNFINENEMPLLQTPYRFTRQHPGGKFVNQDWSLVAYNKDYTIAVQ